MSSKVYFINFRTSFKENLFKNLDKLLDATKISDIVKERNLVAVKLHFGETGNNAFIRPIFFREIVRKICLRGAQLGRDLVNGVLDDVEAQIVKI